VKVTNTKAGPQTNPVPLASPLLDSRVAGVTPHASGKVRDIVDLGDALLLIATDRISAFDYVLGSGIPDKGKVLTQLSAFWFERTRSLITNHVLTMNVSEYPAAMQGHADMLAGRSMLVKKTQPIAIECVARGYLSGSGWKEYRQTGTVCGVQLPPGLRESDRLPEPIFTPATKAASGHDINISEEEAARLVGRDLVRQLREHTLALYQHGVEHAESRGIILADTKFEFGRLPSGDLILIDEVMTPDSSRYWPSDQYAPGGPQPSFDKQYVRDYLEQIRWNKQPPVPSLPEDVVLKTRDKYLEAFRRLTDRDLQ
jgi:phosphoribosylaminoimidazole-succinocarboxamide synthase